MESNGAPRQLPLRLPTAPACAAGRGLEVFDLSAWEGRPPTTLDEWQATLGAWSLATFCADRTRETLAHLTEEISELTDADRAGRGYEDEAADALILLLCYAHRRGFSLAAALARKHAVNLGRRWQADGNGMIRHV
jgi:hypothetical protein